MSMLPCLIAAFSFDANLTTSVGLAGQKRSLITDAVSEEAQPPLKKKK